MITVGPEPECKWPLGGALVLGHSQQIERKQKFIFIHLYVTKADMNNQIKVLGKTMNITNNSDAVSNFLHVNILINVKYLINMCKICHFLTVGNTYIEFYIITLHITYNKKTTLL